MTAKARTHEPRSIDRGGGDVSALGSRPGSIQMQAEHLVGRGLIAVSRDRGRTSARAAEADLDEAGSGRTFAVGGGDDPHASGSVSGFRSVQR